MDANHDGKLSPDEIRKIIKKVNGDLSEYDLNELIDSLDADHDGKVNFDGNRINNTKKSFFLPIIFIFILLEFLSRYGERYAKRHPKEEYELVFKEFDQDNSGYVDENELFNIVKKFNPSITKKQVDHMVQSMDRDHSGKITFDGI